MIKPRNLLWALLVLLAWATGSFRSASAAPPTPAIPAGFRLVASADGVQLYRKEYAKGTPDFVQVIDLSLGAELKLLHGGVANPKPGKGMFGGNNAQFYRQALQKYWDALSAKNPQTFCVTNGQFFYMPDDPGPISLPLKIDGKVITDGYGSKDHPGEQLMLELWNNQADIRALSGHALYTSSAPNILGGFTEEANKRAKQSVGRTFTGVADRDHNGSYETVLVFNTQTAVQEDAAEVLHSFGADKVMMLDGGGSTQLICKNTPYIQSDRPVPQAIGILAAQPLTSTSSLPANSLPLSATLLTQPGWPVLVEGEKLVVDLEVKNSGSATWKAGQVQVLLKDKPWEPRSRIYLRQDTPPGDNAVFTLRLPAFTEWGLYAEEWSLARGSEQFPGAANKFRIVVLPKELKAKRGVLQAQLGEWQDEHSAAEIEPLVREWIAAQLDRPGIKVGSLQIHLGDVAWVSAALLPLTGVVLYALYRQRKAL